MKSYEVDFVAQKSITSFVLDAYEFKPSGRLQWIQKLAWKFLKWRKCLKEAREPKTEIVRFRIDAKSIIEKLVKEKRELFDGFNKTGRRLLIGSEDFAELMNCPEITPYHFDFNAEIGYGRNILGLKIEVIPWMRGFIVMP